MPKISKELISTLFEAGTTMLKEAGKEKFSLQKVAALAGVPNKEALIQILIEREADRHLEILEKKYTEIKHLPLENIIETLIHEIAGAMSRGKIGIKVILTSTFAVERLESLIHARRSLVTFVEKVLNDKNIKGENSLKAHIIVAVLGGVVETIVFKRNDELSDEEIINETTKLVIGYCNL